MATSIRFMIKAMDGQCIAVFGSKCYLFHSKLIVFINYALSIERALKKKEASLKIQMRQT